MDKNLTLLQLKYDRLLESLSSLLLLLRNFPQPATLVRYQSPAILGQLDSSDTATESLLSPVYEQVLDAMNRRAEETLSLWLVEIRSLLNKSETWLKERLSEKPPPNTSPVICLSSDDKDE